MTEKIVRCIAGILFAMVSFIALGRTPALGQGGRGHDDLEWGERVVALVAWQPGTSQLDLTQLRDELSGRLAASALPRGLVGLEAIPLLTTGKPDRSMLRRLSAGDYAGPHSTDGKES